MSRRRLIVVSNRGPVSYGRDAAGRRVAGRGGGGLATALRGLLVRHEVTWIASALTEEDRAVAAEARDGLDEAGSRLILLAHDGDAYHGYYNVVANPLLWFTQHYLWGLGAAPVLGAEFEAAWEAYSNVNRSFADAVVAQLDNSPDATVFFHDYHLYLAPRVVRDARPGAALAHFVHIPWPQSDVWTVLPAAVREAIHDGLLANDVVGLHTDRWRRNLLTSAAELLGAAVDPAGRLGYRGRTTTVTSRPISVDPGEFDALADDADVLAAERELEQGRPERLVLRVDRADPSKNVVRGFTAFGLLLDRHPEWRGRAVLLALLNPSRENVPEYGDYRAAIEREAAAVNERHGAEGYRPVDLRIADDFTQSVAAYKQYDVLLVNAVFDGLNLVAKEAPLVNRRSGVVVLSENAGAHDELREWVITVNPFDVLGQAEALHEALTMDEAERQRRARALAAHVRAHDLAWWIGGLDDLLQSGSA